MPLLVDIFIQVGIIPYSSEIIICVSTSSSRSGTLWKAGAELPTSSSPTISHPNEAKLTNQCTPPPQMKDMSRGNARGLPHRFLLVLQLHAFRADLDIVLSSRFLHG